MIYRRREKEPRPEYKTLTTRRTKNTGHFKLINGEYLLHKEDGPAWEALDGRKKWFLNGQHVPCSSQEEFEKLLKLKAFW